MRLQMVRDERVPGNELVVLHVAGELDIDCAPDLQQAARAIVEGECKYLLLEIDGLLHIDSKGLGTFLDIRQRLRAKGGTISLVCNNEPTRRLFRITNLEKIFEFYPSVADFVRAHGQTLQSV